MRPPMAITSERTTSMPTPRPASSVTTVGGGEARREDQVGELGVARAAHRRRDQAHRHAASRGCAGRFEAGAVVAELDADFVAFLAQRHDDRAGRRPCRPPRAHPASSMPCGDAVAQQVLEGARSCARARRGRLRSSRRRCRAAPACRFPWRPGAPRGRGAPTSASNSDHARAQQVVLQVARQPRLRAASSSSRCFERALQRCAARWPRR